VVYPPVNTRRFSPGRVGDHYLVVSELMPHKQIDVAIAAFNALKLPLVIVGDGPDGRRLRRMAGPTVQFTGRLSDAEVAQLIESARALVVTSIEEFGIAAVESQAAGRPVIAKRGGGALETVVDGVTGCFWSGGADELAAAVVQFDDAAVDPLTCVRQAARFDSQSFRRGLLKEVQAACAADSRPAGSERQPLATTRLVRRAARDPHR
jgi:glycosyltransferase involved in cell wall biosynthesis